ncbi:MAG: tyrosine-type recombinase/integrase [Rhodospirillaceae bacterium]
MTQRLTDQLVQTTTIPPGKSRVTICDSLVPGYIAEVGRQKITLAVKYKEAGVQRQHRLGHFGPSLRTAPGRKQARDFLANRETGKLNSTGNIQSDQTVEDYVKNHFGPYKQLRKRSWVEDMRMLNHRILKLFGSRRLSSVTTPEIQRFVDGIVAGEGRSRSTGNRYLSLIKHMFAMAHRWELIPRDPAKPVDHFVEPPGRDRFLSADEMAALDAALRLESDSVGAAGVLFLLLSGARLGEVLKATWADLDLAGPTWRISLTKSGRPLMRPLSPLAVGLLGSLPRGGDETPVFPSIRTGGHRRDLQRVWVRACAVAGIVGCRLHDLRHCYATNLANRGVAVHTVQALLGHRTVAMTMRYAHVVPAALIAANNLASTIVADAIAGATVTAACESSPAPSPAPSRT